MSQLDSLEYVFYKEDECNPNIGNWDVSNVKVFVSDEEVSALCHHLFKVYL